MTTKRAMLAVGVVAIMVLAGVGIIADSDAADGYTVTYAYEGSQIVKAIGADGSYEFMDFGSLGFAAPEGYAFESWRDTSSSAVYKTGIEYTFAGNVSVMPVFAIDSTHAEIVLIYGDVSRTYVVGGQEGSVASLGEDAIADFAEAIGVSLAVRNGEIVLGDGERFVFGGFGDGITAMEDLTGETGETTVYALTLTPIHTMTFVVDGVTVGIYATNAAITVQDAVKEHYAFVGWSDGAKTVPTAGLAAYAETVGADVVLTAVFEPAVYDVAFVAGDRTEIRSARYGGQIDAPALPEGFKSWADADGRAVAFPYTVLGPATLVAVEIPAYTVTFLAGETVLGTVLVAEGGIIPADAIPALPEGCKTWDADLSAPVTADVAVKAVATVYHTVTFAWGQTAYGDKGYTAVKVEDGAVVEAPAIPDALGDVRWEAAKVSAPIVADIEIALEAIPVYTVTFVAGGETVGTAKVLEGRAVPADAIPEVPEGYSAWAYAGEPVMADTEIVAEAAVAPVYTVTFLVEGKSPIVQMSDSISLPETAREGYAFQGWLVAGSSGYIDPLTYEFTSDTTVTAVYAAVAPAGPAEPSFLETTSGKIALIVGAFAVMIVGALLVSPASPLYHKDLKAKADARAAERRAEKLKKLQEGQEKP